MDVEPLLGTVFLLLLIFLSFRPLFHNIYTFHCFSKFSFLLRPTPFYTIHKQRTVLKSETPKMIMWVPKSEDVFTGNEELISSQNRVLHGWSQIQALIFLRVLRTFHRASYWPKEKAPKSLCEFLSQKTSLPEAENLTFPESRLTRWPQKKARLLEGLVFP